VFSSYAKAEARADRLAGDTHVFRQVLQLAGAEVDGEPTRSLTCSL
jgi:hypothetical protein